MNPEPEPKRYVIDREGQRTEVLDYRGSQGHPTNPEQLLCDFCCERAAHLWCWHVRPFLAHVGPGRDYGYTGGRWCACALCRPFVESRDQMGLLAHVLEINTEIAEVPLEGTQAIYRAMFDAMVDEPPVEWSAGDRWPVPVSAVYP